MSERVPWKESNLALIGSDLDHKIKQAAAQGEPQWDGIGGSTGKRVWRIEKFRVVPWPEDKYGKFHVGDSYIVLNTYKKDGSDALLHDIHMWIGNESSQDEYGTAAYKMVEADEALGGAAVQHREVQSKEGSLFQSYFDRLYYLPGGVETGFHHVEPTKEEPHLYQVKGTSLTHVPLSKSSLCAGDSFVLFAEKSAVWVWHGSSSKPTEKARAMTAAESMCTEGTVKTLDQAEDADPEFWSYLGEGEIKPAGEEGTTVGEFAPVLYRLSPGGGADKVGEGALVKSGYGGVESPKLDRGLLSESDVYLLDAGWDAYLWIGKEADHTEKLSAMSMADSYCKKDPRTNDIPLHIVKSGYESDVFKGHFVE